MGTDPAMQKRFSTLKLPRSRVWNILTPSIHERLSAAVLQPVIGTLLTGCLQDTVPGEILETQIPTVGLIRSHYNDATPMPGIVLEYIIIFAD